MRGVNFTDLLGTELEIVQIDSSLKAINFQTKFYTKHEASELLMKNLAGLSPNGQSPTILHIATHGFFLNNSENLSDPMLRSGIALAGINDYLQDGDKYQGEDGIVKASEIILMDLSNTEIVGLSACETGLGEIKNGEGVYGLQRALKVAGAKAILMSLWKVDDTATQLLMSSFYAAYTTHDKRTAFRMAQQKLKEKYKEPFYWGAFVMIGE
jgi:CHAT domain-containing protein